MKQNIKESFDQIHAPEKLIKDTKRIVCESNYVAKKQKESKIYQKSVVGIVLAAACVAIVCFCFKGMDKDSKTQIPFQQNQVNVGGQDTIIENTIQSVKSVEEWKEYIQNIDVSKDTDYDLKEDYTLYDIPIQRDNKEYTIQIRIQNGVLDCVNEEMYLKGDFYCIVLGGNHIINQSKLELVKSKQFVTLPYDIEAANIIDDNEVIVTLENIEDNGEMNTIRYVIDSKWNIEKNK